MRQVFGIYDAPDPHWVGDGFLVRTMLSHGQQGQAISPFLMLDHAGPFTFAPTAARRGVAQHPHKGFETVTIVYSGEVEHRDSTGTGGVIGAGDVQWMTAGAGILHEEYHSPRFAGSGGRFELVQLWVNLPARHKLAPPHYQALSAREMPILALPGGAGHIRLIAGGPHTGRKGPARTFTPLNVWDVELGPDAETTLDIPEGHTVTILVLSGAVQLDRHVSVHALQAVVLGRTGGGIGLESEGEAKLLVLSGEPIEEPVVAQGPFVMNSTEEIRQALRDFRSGRFGAIEPVAAN